MVKEAMVIYEGPSLIDGTPIVVIAVEDSNPKIGRMLCAHILRQDRPPEVAAFDGSDSAICGGCRWRGVSADTRSCYVRLTDDGRDGHPPADEEFPPSVVWRKWKAGEFIPSHPKYKMSSGSLPFPWCMENADYMSYIGDLPVRLGAYGNPSAAPFEVWEELLRYVKHWTAYEHNWRNCDQRFKRIAMASCDTPEEREEAQQLGWRTFMVVPDTVPKFDFDGPGVFAYDILCPATSTNPKHNTTCSTCLLCRGLGGEEEPMAGFKSIWEVSHGVNKEHHQW